MWYFAYFKGISGKNFAFKGAFLIFWPPSRQREYTLILSTIQCVSDLTHWTVDTGLLTGPVLMYYHRAVSWPELGRTINLDDLEVTTAPVISQVKSTQIQSHLPFISRLSSKLTCELFNSGLLSVLEKAVTFCDVWLALYFTVRRNQICSEERERRTEIGDVIQK